MTGAVEGEIHFVFKCPGLKKQRKGVLDILTADEQQLDEYKRLQLLLRNQYINLFSAELKKVVRSQVKIAV